MMLVDTSVWIEHFSKGNARLQDLLTENEAMIHPFVIGELACGTLSNRTEILQLLARIPHAVEATHGEVLELIERERLFGTGIGWVDAHLVASALLKSESLDC